MKGDVMDSGELNKILGGALGAFLVFLLLGFASAKIYGTKGHHGDEPQAFAVEIEDAGGTEPDEGPDIAALIASADAAAGKKVFGKCKSCHKLEDGANGVGPHLLGVFGRKIAGAEGFSYSNGLSSKEGNWDVQMLFEFLENPKGWANSAMAYRLKKAEDRINVIAYLNEADGSPEPLE